MEKLLSVTEAAIKLGITKELLFAYIRNAPKTHLGEDRKLQTVVKDGQNYFTEAELDSFDEYLQKPWANPDGRRPEIPTYIKEYLKVEIGGKCPITGKGYPLDNAHIIPYEVSLNHYHHNLIRVAKEEHTKADNGVIPRAVLGETKRKLIDSLRKRLELEDKNYQSSFHPPKPHPILIGRAAQLFDLMAAMEVERIIVIQGLGGMGKTQLLLNAFANVRYHNPVIWIDVETVGTVSDLLVVLSNAVAPYIRSSSDSLVDALRRVQLTLVFDSLEKLLITEKDETEDLIKALMTKTELVQLLITSQVDLSIFGNQKRIFEVGRLEDGYDKILLEELTENQITLDEHEFLFLLDFCNGHPLSIKLVSSLLKFYRSADHVANLLEESGKLNHPTRKKHDKSTSLEACLATIYNCLTPEQKHLLQYLKFFPAGVKSSWLEGLLKSSSFQFDVATLLQFFFLEIRIDQLEFERIMTPNPIRPFLRSKALDKSKESTLQLTAVENTVTEAIVVCHRYIENGKDGYLQYGLARFEDEFPNLLEIFRIAQEKSQGGLDNSKLKKKYLEAVIGIASSLGKYCFLKGLFDYGETFSIAGIKASIELGYFRVASTNYMYLSQLQSRRFDITGFSQTVEKIKELALKTGDIAIKADSAWANGRLEFDKQNYEQALVHFEAALSFLHRMQSVNAQDQSLKSDPSIRGNLSLLMSEIAKVYEFTENYEEAVKRHKEAIIISEEINDEGNLPSSYHHLAHCLCETGWFSEGLGYYGKAIEGFLDAHLHEYVANSISDLGRYIEDHPEVSELPVLTQEVYEFALNSVSYQIIDSIRRGTSNSSENNIEKIPFLLLVKLIWMVKVIGFSPQRIILSDWAYKLTTEVPLENSEPNLYFAIINLTYAVGGVDEWKSLEKNRPIMIRTILQSSLLINGGPDIESKTRIFQWLAKWMKHTGLDLSATPEKLWKEAWATFDEISGD